VAVLDDGHFGQCHPVGQGGGGRRGIGQPEETAQGGVGQHPEQVNHAFSGLAVVLQLGICHQEPWGVSIRADTCWPCLL
jgi:hypothetical protein